MKITSTLCLFCATCLTLNAFAQETIPAIPLKKPKPAPKVLEKPAEPTPLYVGDNAPELTIDHWVKGDAIDSFATGQVYVIEFWATWCGPCITSMPHLSELQDKYGEQVKIIGVSSEKELETVTTFLQKKNRSDDMLNDNRMRYTVAVDPDRTTSNVFMKAAGQNGIPTAFIINGDGQVAWIGHPMRIDEPLKEVVSGSWDIVAAADAFRKEAIQEKAWSKFIDTYRTAMGNGDWDKVLAAIDSYSDEFGETQSLQTMKFEALLIGKNDKTAAYALADEMATNNWENAQALNSLAWNIVDSMPEEHQDVDFALKCATRAMELDKNEPMILDTLARVYWVRGEIYKAIAWQERAVRYTEDSGSMSDSIRATLDEYKASLANVYNNN